MSPQNGTLQPTWQPLRYYLKNSLPGTGREVELCQCGKGLSRDDISEMRRNENQFLLLDLLLQEAKGYQLRETSEEAAIGLLDQIKSIISILDYDNRQQEPADLVSMTLGSLSVAGSLVHQGNIPHAFTVTKLALIHLLRKAALFQAP